MNAPALVILAAGASERLGTCKALADLGGTSALAALCANGAALGPAPILVVVGAHAREIAAALPAGCEACPNPDWSSGRTSSVRAAIRARRGLDLCFAPVDVPLVPAAVFAALAHAWRAAGAPAQGWLAPWVAQGTLRRHGHPVLLGRELCEAILEAPGRAALKEFRSRARPLLGIEVRSPEILDDLDTPADLAEMRRRRGFSAQIPMASAPIDRRRDELPG